MDDPLLVLAEHVARTLPDSITQRRSLLRALKSTLTTKHRAYDVVSGMLGGLDAHDELQRELPLLFTQKAKGKQ